MGLELENVSLYVYAIFSFIIVMHNIYVYFLVYSFTTRLFYSSRCI